MKQSCGNFENTGGGFGVCAVVRIVVCQGESRRLDNNVVIGDLVLAGLPPRPRGETSIEVTFSLDMRLGARAGFKRNERMLSLDPRYVIAFPGNGVLERLVIEAKARRITVVDRRGPLGTNPKNTSARND